MNTSTRRLGHAVEQAFLAGAIFHVFVFVHEYVHLAHAYLSWGSLPNGWVIEAQPLAMQYNVVIFNPVDFAANAILANAIASLLALALAVELARRERWVVAVGPSWYYLATCYRLLSVSGFDGQQIHAAYGYAPAVALLVLGVGVAAVGIVRKRRALSQTPRDAAHGVSSSGR